MVVFVDFHFFFLPYFFQLNELTTRLVADFARSSGAWVHAGM